MEPTFQFETSDYVVNQLPPQYRLDKFQLLFNAALYAIKWRFDNWKEYQEGAAYNAYDDTQTYSKEDKVTYSFGIYQSLTDSNTGNNPSTSPDAWIKCNDNFIGMNERIFYNGTLMTLTWALNRQFSTIWRELPWPAPYDFGLGGGTFPDIYITKQPVVFATFLSGTNSSNSSTSGLIGSTGYASLLPIFNNQSTYSFIVHFPVAVYNSLGANDTIRKAVVSQFINKYTESGTTFTIQTY